MFPLFLSLAERAMLTGAHSGGHWAPGIATHFLSKSSSRSERAIGISNIGIFNGIVDFLVQGEHFASFARNNTYGIEAYSQAVADSVTEALEGPGGCREQAVACQDLAIELDPQNTGTNTEVQELCKAATFLCSFSVYGPYLDPSVGLKDYDITQEPEVQFSPPHANGFLNRESVQKKLGVDIAGGKGVNYTYANSGILACEFSAGLCVKYLPVWRTDGVCSVHGVRRLPPERLPPPAG